MKHLTRKEALKRMTMAFANIIELGISCELTWYRPIDDLELAVYLHNGEVLPKLTMLRHQDIHTKSISINANCTCYKYLWDSYTAQL